MQIKVFSLENLKNIQFEREKSQVLATQTDRVLTVKELIESLAKEAEEIKQMLKVLGEETYICRIFYLNGEAKISIPKIYMNEQQIVKMYDANSIPQPINKPLDFIQYTTDYIRQQGEEISGTIVGQQVIKITEGKQSYGFCVPIGISDEYIQAVVAKDKAGESLDAYLYQGKGTPPIKALKYYPRPYKPISQFEKGETYKILANLGSDPRYENGVRFKLQQLNGDTPVGEPIEVLANYSLRQHWETFGDRPCTVTEKIQKTKGYRVKFAMTALAKAR